MMRLCRGGYVWPYRRTAVYRLNTTQSSIESSTDINSLAAVSVV